MNHSAAPRTRSFADVTLRVAKRVYGAIHHYFFGFPRSFWIALLPLVLLSVLLFTRSLETNCIFDEQEALLANPYVHGSKLPFRDAIHRDFWGLPPERSIGSYRPLPNYLWRTVWEGQKAAVSAVNSVHDALILVGAAIKRPANPPSWWCWPNVLFAICALFVALPAAGAAVRTSRKRVRIGMVAACVGALALAVSGAMGWVWYFLGGAAAVALCLLMFPLVGPSLALVFGLLALGLQALADVGPQPLTLQMHPWVFHWVNVLLHGVNGAILVVFVDKLTGRRGLSWLVGVLFVSSAVLTEAVSGVVGIADVMAGLGACLALVALLVPMWAMPLLVFASVLIGLFSKESALVLVPLVPFAALVLAHLTHPKRPMRWVRAVLAFVAAAGALALYAHLRGKWFPAPVPEELRTPLPDGANALARAMHWFRGWLHQGALPRDPINNPLVNAPDFAHRTSGALRVFFRGLVQVVFPRELSGDYSAPQEPVPAHPYELPSVLGAIAMVALPLISLVLVAVAWWRERAIMRSLRNNTGKKRPDLASLLTPSRVGYMAVIAALGLMWTVVAYFPHSNIPVLLPTVRAERFWYFPVMGTSMALAVAFVKLFELTQKHWHGAIIVGVCTAFVCFQGARARTHAMDYADDLTFWDATRKAVPRSAKAHLNYSVMWGARGRLDIRLSANQRALKLAPNWPMANIYLGDTLCRLHRTDEAWKHYRKGFELDPANPNLVALSLQCLWDENSLEDYRGELVELADKHPGSWLAYLANDTLNNGKKNDGVDPKYRPRGYNEGPRE